MIFAKENIVELSLIDHFSASAASVEVAFRCFAQLIKVSGIHFSHENVLALFQTGTVLASKSKRPFADTLRQLTPVIGALTLL